MKKKIVWLVVSCLMVLSLVLASCAPAVTEKKEVAPAEEAVVTEEKVVVPEEAANMVKWRGVKVDGTVVEKMIEKPKYGGTHIVSRPEAPTTFDDLYYLHSSAWAINPTNEVLTSFDWTRGPGGTGEWSPPGVFPEPGYERPMLAESWEAPDPNTYILHIRQGVKWALDQTSEASRLVGGRQLTTDDVLFNLRLEWKSGYAGRNSAFLAGETTFPPTDEIVNNAIYISPDDKWTIVMKVQPGTAGAFFEYLTQYRAIMPPEVIQKYGDMRNWRNVVGTGPFTLKDYVADSALTYIRNPNYWGTDPFFPENQLPYVDTVKVLIIKDLSTQMSALRTGKIDRLYDLEAEQAESLLRGNPELKQVSFLPGSIPALGLRTDTKPFTDVRVRQALNMAVNKPNIVKEYYDGKADLFSWPVPAITEYMDMYVPLEQMPESVRDLYEYRPDKAKQLLAEAGYPNGFKTEVITKSGDADLLSIVKADWAKVGVDLAINVVEPGIWTNMKNAKTHTQILMNPVSGRTIFKLSRERPVVLLNANMNNDPWVEDGWLAISANWFDVPKKQQIMKNLVIPFNEAAWNVVLPAPWTYNLWQPWLKNVYGMDKGGYYSSLGSVYYGWIDQELKKAMGR